MHNNNNNIYLDLNIKIFLRNNKKWIELSLKLSIFS